VVRSLKRNTELPVPNLNDPDLSRFQRAVLGCIFDTIPFEYIKPAKRDVLSAAKHVAQKDAPIIAAAKRAKVDFLVTLDKRHLLGRPELAAYVGTRIVAPKSAVESIRSTN
jgi:predicted nucleic acid-binding protein